MVPGPYLRPRRATEGARACDVPGVFVTDGAELWHLPHGSVTEGRAPIGQETPCGLSVA